jgi:16S rRNA (cytosine1402-N4)-methyltransferase
VGAHVPVLLAEVLELVDPRPGERVLDATVGCGGHAKALADRIGSRGMLVGVDRDGEALERAAEELRGVDAEVHLCRANFRDLEDELDQCGQDEVDVALFDFGMSSLQVDDPARGFSFRSDGPLDMRMDPRQPTTAEELVNETGEEELADLIFNFGEERESRKIARAIVRERLKGRIKTTVELATLIARAKKQKRGRIHPATKVFQALRMAVNDEVESLVQALEAAWRRLSPGGRVAAISFHSIEDRIVKNMFRDKARNEDATLVTKKPVTASDAECEANPRSRSAKLRVLRKGPEKDLDSPARDTAS